MRRATRFRRAGILGVLAILLAVACRGREEWRASPVVWAGEERTVNRMETLERKIAEGDWSAVDLAASLGTEGLPGIRRGAGLPNSLSRHIAMICAGKVGGDTAGEILALGLKDRNIDVRTAAAGQLMMGTPATARIAVLDALKTEGDPSIREFLVLAAGHVPGERTVKLLRPLAEGNDALARNARKALARLGDKEARERLIKELSAPSPWTRYEAVGDLRYVDDPEMSRYVVHLLSDTANADLIGPERNPRYRRVCDQAVDTLARLRKLSLPFRTSVETIYTDEQLAHVRGLVK